MKEMIRLNRRDFLKATGLTGLGLILNVPIDAAVAEQAFIPGPFIRIEPDGRVFITVSRSEMGQGVYTSLPMIVAEELEVKLDDVIIEQAEAEFRYGVMATGGSNSVKSMFRPLARAGATAREMLIAAASEELGISKSKLIAKNGSVSVVGTQRQISYSQLVSTAAKYDPADFNVKLKSKEDYRVIGGKGKRQDTLAKITGKAIFGVDVSLDELVIATVKKCPYVVGKLKNWNSEKALKIKGVEQVIKVDNHLAVVADSYFTAQKAADILEAEWVAVEDFSTKSVHESLVKAKQEKASEGFELGQRPNTISNDTLTIDYEAGWQAHATMEPQTCTVKYSPTFIEIWTPTQVPIWAKKTIESFTGLSPSQVRFHVTFLGGGFGRRLERDMILEAVKIARKVKSKKPVKVIWSREADMRNDFYRPASLHCMRASFDKGSWSSVEHKLISDSILASKFGQGVLGPNKVDPTALEGSRFHAYQIPYQRVDYKYVDCKLPIGWWRSVYDSQNAFAKECFVDQVARKLEKDPGLYRVELLTDSPRHKRVLQEVLLMSKWDTPTPKDKGRGCAVHKSFNSYVAMSCELSLRNNTPVIEKVYVAVDCGLVVHPDTVEAQVQGSIVFGMMATLFGEINVDKGQVMEGNFHQYWMPQIQHMPEVNIKIVDSDEAPTGIGEPVVPLVAPAIANALLDLTGKQPTRIPIKA
ncbi:MAG: molybdopterin cofactor-binding domain-containing protein [bacterium]|nr:molybdopterin cofactor-binding domain-containing protein [bacterium]